MSIPWIPMMLLALFAAQGLRLALTQYFSIEDVKTRRLNRAWAAFIFSGVLLIVGASTMA